MCCLDFLVEEEKRSEGGREGRREGWRERGRKARKEGEKLIYTETHSFVFLQMGHTRTHFPDLGAAHSEHTLQLHVPSLVPDFFFLSEMHNAAQSRNGNLSSETEIFLEDYSDISLLPVEKNNRILILERYKIKGIFFPQLEVTNAGFLVSGHYVSKPCAVWRQTCCNPLLSSSQFLMS